MSGLLSFLGTAMPHILGIGGIIDEQIRYAEAREANQRQYDEAIRLHDELYARTMDSISAHNAEMDGAHKDRSERILKAYQDRYDRGMARIEDDGKAEKRELNQSFHAAGQKAKQQAVNAGLAGTTVMPSLSTGVRSAHADAIGKLNETINRRKFEADMTLSGDTLDADERMSGDYLAGNDARFAFETGTDQQLTSNKIATVSSQVNPYPQMTAAQSYMNWWTEKQRPKPESDDSALWGGLANTGVNLLTGLI